MIQFIEIDLFYINVQYPSRKVIPPPALVDNVFHSSDVHLAGILKTQKSQKIFSKTFYKVQKAQKVPKIEEKSRKQKTSKDPKVSEPLQNV